MASAGPSPLNPSDEYVDRLAEERKRGLTDRERALISTEHANQDQTWWSIAWEYIAATGYWAVTSVLVWVLLITLIFGGIAMYSINRFMDVRADKMNEIEQWEF